MVFLMLVTTVSCFNLRELSRKEKFLWLNAKSWIISGLIPLCLMSFIGMLNMIILYSLFIFAFSIAEFFDEDITDILTAFAKIKTDTKIYYA